MRNFVVVLLLIISQLSVAQQSFRYVIIPTQFSDIGKDFNPYGVSSSLQRAFNGKGIASVFESLERPVDFCDALTVEIEKTSSLFTNKLMIKLKDCRNRIVWSGEGVGRSKDFVQGYSEAVSDALSSLDALPENTNHDRSAVVMPEVIGSSADEPVYKPENLYFNDTYFVDVIDSQEGNGVKKLIIVNGKLLGYGKLQEIAVLTPIEGTESYAVKWVTPEGHNLGGMADLNTKNLKITLISDNNPVVINMVKQ